MATQIDPYTPRCIFPGCDEKATVIRQVHYLDKRQPSPKYALCAKHTPEFAFPPEYDTPGAIFAVVGPDPEGKYGEWPN